MSFLRALHAFFFVDKYSGWGLNFWRFSFGFSRNKKLPCVSSPCRAISFEVAMWVKYYSRIRKVWKGGYIYRTIFSVHNYFENGIPSQYYISIFQHLICKIGKNERIDE